jgi:hypothetical protein
MCSVSGMKRSPVPTPAMATMLLTSALYR